MGFIIKTETFHSNVWVKFLYERLFDMNHLIVECSVGCSWGAQDQRRPQSSYMDVRSELCGYGEPIGGRLCRGLPSILSLQVSVL
jgi:hypothetical protein